MEESISVVDITPVLDYLSTIEETNLVLITLLSFLSAVVLLLLFSGGWGNG